MYQKGRRTLAWRAFCAALVILGVAAGVLPGAHTTASAATTTLTQNLPAGWSLVSVPLVPTNAAPGAVFANLTDPLRLYQRGAGLWQGAAEPGFSAVQNGRGYWLLSDKNTKVQATGAVPAPNLAVRIPLTPGWNLVGPPWPEPLDWSDARIQVAAEGSTVPLSEAVTRGWVNSEALGFNSATGAYVPVAANGGAQLQAWQGYLVYANVTGELIVLPPPADTTPPVVSLQGPLEDAILTGPVPVMGTATDSRLVQYTLEYAPAGSSEFVPIASGTTPTENGTLATLDPTVLPNGLGTIRLSATDVSGNISTTQRSYIVDGENKPGIFSITFEDLNIPVAGVPLIIKRTYDTRTRGYNGDFGYGWRMEIDSAGTYRNNRQPGDGWNVTESEDFFKIPCTNSQATKSHVTEIRFSDWETYRFAFQVGMYGYSSIMSGGCLGDAGFVQTGGIPGATLQIIGDNEVFWPTDMDHVTFAPGTNRYGQVYVPENVRLTLRDGREFDLNLEKGITRIQDANGNAIYISQNAVVHSSGKGVGIIRDSQGRIETIIDPAGKQITYDYNTGGDLISMTDRVNATTTFTYEPGHYLKEIINALGERGMRYEYDEDGRLIAVYDSTGKKLELTQDLATRTTTYKDRLGNPTTITYDDKGYVLSETNALGHTAYFTYDERGNVLTEKDELGHISTATFDANDNLLTLTDAAGNTFGWSYDTKGQMETLTDARGHTISGTYDEKGNLETVTDQMGHVTQFDYDIDTGFMTSWTDASGRTTSYEYNENGDVKKETDDAGNVTTFTYDDNGNLLTETTTRTDATGAKVTVTTRMVYDDDGRLIEEVDPLGHSFHTEYDGADQVVAEVDKLNHRTEYKYDTEGNLIEKVHPDGTSEKTTYNAEGYQTATTDTAGRITTYGYDALNRPVRVTGPDGHFVQREYDKAGRLIGETDENGYKTTYEYDAIGRLTRQVDPLGNEMLYTYDRAGNTTSVTDGEGHSVEHEYDKGNRLTKTTLPDGTTIHYEYDGEGQRTAQIDQNSNKTSYEYSHLGLITKVTDALNNVTTYSYDELGNLTAQTDANSHTTRWGYDSLGRVTSHTLPLGMTEYFTYDANGNLLSHTDFNGVTTQFTYDVMNRLIRKTYPGGSTVNYSYTPTGQLLSVTDSRGTTGYSYDLRDRLLSVTHPDGTTISYTYDKVGNRTTITTPSGTTTYAFDKANRLSSVTAPDGAVTSYTYDKTGRVLSETKQGVSTTAYTYDTLGRLTGLEHFATDGSLIASYTYTLDDAGNRKSVTEASGRTVNYTYDDLYRVLTEAIIDPVTGTETITYTYDDVGNRLTRTDSAGTTSYTYDENDRLLTAGSVTYTYDNNGNTLTETDGSTTTTYGYDYENRLTTVTDGTNTATYTYDHAGNLVSTTVNGVTTRFLVDTNREHAQVIEERDGTDALVARYVHGHRLISQERDGETSYYLADALASTRALTDATGAVTDSYTYDAYGELLASAGITANPYRFAGERLDSASELYHLRARYYNPAVGRFLTTDPFEGVTERPATRHRYMYAEANPVNLTDPSGLFTIGEVSISLNIQSSLRVGGANAGRVGATQAVRRTLLKSFTKWAQKTARQVIKMCTKQRGPATSRRRSNPCAPPIFLPGMDTEATTFHIGYAIYQHPHTIVLLRRWPAHPRGWLDSTPICRNRMGKVCDEYPFASTMQGGQANYQKGDVSLMLIKRSEQNKQGGYLRSFYRSGGRGCDIKPFHPIKGWFAVIPSFLPKTTWKC